MVSDDLFSDTNHNFYFTQIEHVTCFSASIFKKRQSYSALFAFGVNTADVIILKMPAKGMLCFGVSNAEITYSYLLDSGQSL